MQEEWKDVGEYPDLFKVSNLGRVWSKRTNKILKQGILKTGYKVINTKIGGRNGECICKRVHRWVACAFIDNPMNKPFVNHIDGDKCNNVFENLEWCTASENSEHSYRIGLSKKLRGRENPNFTFTDEQVSYIKQNYKSRCSKYGARAMARKFGVSHSTILRVVNMEYP